MALGDTQIGGGIPGIDFGSTEGSIDSLVNIVPYIGPINSLSKFFGGPSIGGLFGGGGGHKTRFPDFDIPKILSSRGIKVPFSNLSSSSFHRLGPKIAEQQIALGRGKITVRKLLQALGFVDDAKKFNDYMNGLTLFHASSPSDAFRKSQQQLNSLAGMITFMDTVESERSQFLKDNPEISKSLDIQTQKIRTRQFRNDPFNYKPDSALATKVQTHFFIQGKVPQPGDPEFVGPLQPEKKGVISQLVSEFGDVVKGGKAPETGLLNKAVTAFQEGNINKGTLALALVPNLVNPQFDTSGRLTKLQLPELPRGNGFGISGSFGVPNLPIPQGTGQEGLLTGQQRKTSRIEVPKQDRNRGLVQFPLQQTRGLL